MKYCLISVIMAALFTGCGNVQQGGRRYTKEQIASLELESTKILSVETGSAEIIDLNPFVEPQEFDFTPLVKEVRLVPLETTDESLLDAIRKVVVTDSHIYIMDDLNHGGLVIFDNEGRFIRRIPHGKGPGELMRLYDIAFDHQNNELIAYIHSFLLFYTPSGQFIRQERLPFLFHNFTVIPDGYVFKTLGSHNNLHLNELNDYTLLETGRDFRIETAALPLSPDLINLENRHYLHNASTGLLVTQKFTDTIFQYVYQTNLLKARYVLDYESKRLPQRYVKGTWEEFEKAVQQNIHSYFLGKFLQTTNHSVFLLHRYNPGRVVIYRDNITGNLIGGTTIQYDHMEIPWWGGHPQATFGNYFVSWYHPGEGGIFTTTSTIIPEKYKKKAHGLTEYDNPVLVFFKLKNF